MGGRCAYIHTAEDKLPGRIQTVALNDLLRFFPRSLSVLMAYAITLRSYWVLLLDGYIKDTTEAAGGMVIDGVNRCHDAIQRVDLITVRLYEAITSLKILAAHHRAASLAITPSPVRMQDYAHVHTPGDH